MGGPGGIYKARQEWFAGLQSLGTSGLHYEMNALEPELFSLHATCSSCPCAFSKDEHHKALLLAVSLGCSGDQAGRQAAPTCCMDRHKDHRIFLGPSNSFLLLSCPY